VKKFDVWGMTGTLVTQDPLVEEEAMKRLGFWLDAVDASCNRFRDDSEIARLNASGGSWFSPSATFESVLQRALDASAMTQGLCDPTVLPALENLGYDRDYDELASMIISPRPTTPTPGVASIELDLAQHRVRLHDGARLDLGASAKAFVADTVAAELAEHGGALVEIGGDVAVRGEGPQGPWVIGVGTSLRVGANEPRVAFTNGGVATSSTVVRTWRVGQRRVHHVIDPRTGDCANSVYSTATVSAADCLTANAFATAALLWNEEAGYHVAQAGWSARLVRHDGTVEFIGGWPEEEVAS